VTAARTNDLTAHREVQQFGHGVKQNSPRFRLLPSDGAKVRAWDTTVLPRRLLPSNFSG